MKEFTQVICRYLFLTLVFTIILPAFSVKAMPQENVFVDFEDMRLFFNMENGTSSLQSIFMTGYNISTTNDFEIIQVKNKPGYFHLRKKTWKDFFWQIDAIDNYNIKKVTGNSFGIFSPESAVIPGLKIGVYGKPGNITNISINFKKAFLSYNTKNDNIQLIADDMVLFDKNELECTRSGSYYDIRYRHADTNFFRIDTNSNTLFWQTGKSGHSGKKIMNVKVRIESYETAAGIFEDLAFTENNETRHPKSAWIESQKELYKNILKRNKYDVLVVPFQIQGYAIDRVGRSLMTRYITDYLSKTTDLRIPDPTLVARAFGENSRNIDENEIYHLANELKVKLLIRCSVGHRRDEKMKITLLIDEARDGKEFSFDVNTPHHDWQDIPFSDEYLPEEVFKNDLLAKVIQKLPVNITKKTPKLIYEKKEGLAASRSAGKYVRFKKYFSCHGGL